LILDALIVVVVGLAVWRGVRRGLIRSLTGLAGFVVAVIVAVLAFRLVAVPLERVLGLSTGVANLAGAMGLFLAVTVAARVAGNALTRLVAWSKLGTLNKLGGAAISGTWAAAWVAVVLLSISVIPAPSPIASALEDSAIGSGIVDEAPAFVAAAARTDLRRALVFFFPRTEQRVAIRATTDFHRLAGAERELFEMINEERAARELAPLAWDEQAARAGRLHVADMYRRGYFGHESPAGTTPAERLRAQGAIFRIASENLALAPDMSIAHARLMGSSGHRRHILSTRFTRVGIGVVYGAQGLLIAQEFAG